MATLVHGKTFGSTETVTAEKLHKLVDEATISGITNIDIASNAAIDSSKIAFSLSDYVTIAGDQTITGVKTFNQAPVMPDAFWSKLYPVGIVITLGVSTNPATLFGFGTWTAIAGKVIVGLNAGDTEFDTLNETGGEKTHTLTTGEIPAHTHSYDIYGNGTGTNGQAYPASCDRTDTTHLVGATNQNSDAGGAHNNLQPYIVKYVWERTA